MNNVSYGQLISACRPVPLMPPVYDKSIPGMPFMARSAAVLHYRILRLEYWLSPRGSLRAWVKLNVLLGVALGIPTVIIGPIIIVAFSVLAAIAMSVLTIVKCVFYAMLYVIGITLIFSTGLTLMAGNRSRQRH